MFYNIQALLCMLSQVFQIRAGDADQLAHSLLRMHEALGSNLSTA